MSTIRRARGITKITPELEQDVVVEEKVTDSQSVSRRIYARTAVHERFKFITSRLAYFQRFSRRTKAIAFVLIFGLLGTYLVFFAGASPQPVELTGTLEILTVPHDHGAMPASANEDMEMPYDFKNDYYYALKTTDGKRVPLDFNTEPKTRGGSKVKVKGHKEAAPAKSVGLAPGTAFAAASAPTTTADGTPYVNVDSIEPVNVTDLPPVLGIQAIAVIKVNFSNAAYSGAGTSSDTDIRNAYFDGPQSANAFIHDTSYGRAGLSGDILSVTIPNRDDETGIDMGCAAGDWATAVNDAAASQGVDLSGYGYKSYLLPPTTTCHFPALGSIGDPHLSWMNGTVDAYEVAHEVGHNFGLMHANGLKCSSGKTKVSISTAANCTEIGYSDWFDTLGGNSGTPIQYSAIHKEHLGWLYSSNIQDINQTGNYRIYRSEVATNHAMAIRFPRRDTNQYYYLETRRPLKSDVAFKDASLFPVDDVIKGVTVRLGRTSSETTLLLKADPAAKTNGWFAAPITAPATGATDTFTDSDAGVSVKFVSQTDRYTNIKVTFTKAPIGTSTPTPASKYELSAAPEGSLKPLNVHDVNDCGGREYMTAVDTLDNLPSLLQTYTEKVGSAYDAPFGGAVPLYSFKTTVKYSRTCTSEDYFFSTDANATKPASYDTRAWTRDEEVAWVFPTQATGSIPLYHWACPLNNSSNNSTLNPLVSFYHTDDQWIYRSYSAPGSCSRETIGYILPATATDPGQPQAWHTSSNALPAGRDGHTSVVANGYVYVIGGAPGPSTTVFYAKLNADGTTGAWQASPNALPAPRVDHGSVVLNGYVYVIGGDDDDSFNSQASVFYAKLNADGTTGAWQATNSLPQPLQDMGTATANGYIYTFGGTNSYFQKSVVYYAKANADGTIGTWQTNANSNFPTENNTSVVIANGYVYAVGGTWGASPKSTVVYAKLNTDGSTSPWAAGGDLPLVLEHSTTVVKNGYLYAIGGETNSAVSVSNVYFTKLNADGTYGPWATSAQPLPSTLEEHSTVINNGFVYVMGGSKDPFNPALSTVYYSSF